MIDSYSSPLNEQSAPSSSSTPWWLSVALGGYRGTTRGCSLQFYRTLLGRDENDRQVKTLHSMVIR